MAGLKRGQAVEVAFWLALAAGAYAFSFTFDREIEIYRFGATGWPRVVIVVLAFTALGLLVEYLRARPDAPAGARAGPEPDGARASIAHIARMTVTLLLPLGYALVLDYTGFYATTPVFIFVYLLITGERRPLYLILTPLAISLAMTLIFTKLLYVGLPVGYVSPFYDFSNWLLTVLQ